MIFNRFVKVARRDVEAAVEEARLMGHDSVGDEDLLLGILRTDEGVAAEALTSLGITLGDVREELKAMLSDTLSNIGISFEEIRLGAGDAFEMSLPEDRKIPFSPRAKNALEQALAEALRMDDNHIGTEHILLGILRNEYGTAVRILDRLGIPPAVLEERLDQVRGRSSAR